MKFILIGYLNIWSVAAAQIIQERKHQHFLSLGPLSTSSSSLPSTPHSVRSNNFGIPGPYPQGSNTAPSTNHSNSGAPPTPTAGRRNLSGGSREGSRDSSQPSPSSTPNFTRKSRRKSNLFTVRLPQVMVMFPVFDSNNDFWFCYIQMEARLSLLLSLSVVLLTLMGEQNQETCSLS